MKPVTKKIAVSLALSFAAFSANAELERVGPNNAWGFPSWYQDTTGIALEYCNPLNQAELDGGYCLVLPTDVTLPEPAVVGENYFEEHFWWAGEALMDTAQGSRALLVMAAEAAFAAAPPAPGGQVAFTRIRVRLDAVPVTGTYRFIHPYGEESGFAEAGERVFITDDVGINCPPGQFDCAMTGRIGPFLMASDTPGGLELPAVEGPVPGKLYIAAPDRSGPVTGSPLPEFIASDGLPHNHNVFRIEGPPGSNLGGPGVDFIETHDFALIGRLYSGVMPGRIGDLRANYADRNVSGRKVDVFLTAEPTGQTRVPGPYSERPPQIEPVTTFFDRPCQATIDVNGNTTYSQPAGALERVMGANGSHRWGQVRPTSGNLPTAVCVKDTAGRDLAGNTIASFHDVRVRDEVTITEARYEPNTQTLSVAARSSDEINVPTLTLQVFGTDRTLVDGRVEVLGVGAPPESVLVSSSANGSATQRVDTGYADVATDGPVAVDDTTITVDEDSSVIIPVLANDDPGGVATVTLVANGAVGTAVVNADQTVTYTPRANVGDVVDLLSYQITVDNVVSNVATIMVTINGINDAPVAVNDLITGAVGVPLTIAPLANDTDVDGPSLTLVGLSGVTGPAGAVTSLVDNADGTVTFTADRSGTYSFDYAASDGQYATPATVTVSIDAPETLVTTSGEFRSSRNRWKVGGTSSIIGDHNVTVTLTGAGCVEEGRVLGSVPAIAGVFALDVVAPAPGAGCTQVRAVSDLGGIASNFTYRSRN